MRLILASASPRRAEILARACIPFEALPASVEESRFEGESVEAMVHRLAAAKARAVASRLAGRTDSAIVVGADTAVELDGELFGKPGSAAAVREMLRRLSGRTHRVLTALAFVRLPDGAECSGLEVTAVRFAPLADEEIREYAAMDEPLDKAGGYAIQGFAGRFVERVEGCYFNVVGLPLARLYRMLKEWGWRQPDKAP